MTQNGESGATIARRVGGRLFWKMDGTCGTQGTGAGTHLGPEHPSHLQLPYINALKKGCPEKGLP